MVHQVQHIIYSFSTSLSNYSWSRWSWWILDVLPDVEKEDLMETLHLFQQFICWWWRWFKGVQPNPTEKLVVLVVVVVVQEMDLKQVELVIHLLYPSTRKNGGAVVQQSGGGGPGGIKVVAVVVVAVLVKMLYLKDNWRNTRFFWW